jgi:hypothetical protein
LRSAHKALRWPNGLEVVLDDPLEALILDLLEWIGPQPRAYSEVIAAWGTSCPRLPVWEEANDRGFVTREHGEGRRALIALTPLGREHLARHPRGWMNSENGCPSRGTEADPRGSS